MTHGHDVHLRVPADSAYVSVIRTTVAGLAARLDFTLDDIEDLRIAVGEACAMVLTYARPDGALTADFDLGEEELTVHVTAEADAPPEPDRGSFAWQVLTALTTEVQARTTADTLTLTLRVHAEDGPTPRRPDATALEQKSDVG